MRSFYAFGIASWFLVVWSFRWAVMYDPFYRWFVGPILIFLTIYQLSNYGLNLFYKKFNLGKHLSLVKSSPLLKAKPSVDIYLPICGESMEVLHNTWKHVALINYTNKRVFVLDDSKEECLAHKELAEQYGYTYLERPDKGWMKKAGNLKYAFDRTEGEFIAIFDADFAPHPDFITELLPYMEDEKVGIVQSAQYFNLTKTEHNKSPLAYGAGYVQEAFYRFIQVIRDRFGSTVCCGSNAIYRRAALADVGGIVLIDTSEDLHTGFALTDLGWTVRYVPLILAVGICPDNAHAYFHQQHRWCFASLSLISSASFWRSKVNWKVKLSYLAGLFYYLHHPIILLFSFQLFWTLFFYNPYISFTGSIPFYPYILWSFAYMLPGISIARFYWGCFYASFMQIYAYTHAIFSTFARRTVGWIPSNSKQSGASPAFRQTTIIVGLYVFVYGTLTLIMARYNMLHLLDYNYYAVQFWIFWNLFFSGLILWQMTKFILSRKR